MARHAVAATLQGVKRCWEKPPKPVMPVTLADLEKMALLISVHDLKQEALWAAILVSFFGLFRKDNLTTGKADAWHTQGGLRWVPLRAVSGSLLCPVRALLRLMERTMGRPGDSPLFVMEKVTGRRGTVVPMTHDAQRGGATAAMRLDINSIYIKMQGDRKSDCFERYCELDTEQKLVLPGAMAEAAAALR
ncbi:hypothetical protein CYMTET_48790 [Cymbomonas tetramitiformis]|uniref:Uncharacterized protein n=1 Tax=Cymbomonas tetramitiformis TaxID=36881 RepID=A0AAE0BSS6_9CHLO|nr:hypothetical protein CYMTET_48790 [Cymbomonas tetramitiformis]